MAAPTSGHTWADRTAWDLYIPLRTHSMSYKPSKGLLSKRCTWDHVFNRWTSGGQSALLVGGMHYSFFLEHPVSSWGFVYLANFLFCFCSDRILYYTPARLSLNSWSLCLSFPRAGIIDLWHKHNSHPCTFFNFAIYGKSYVSLHLYVCAHICVNWHTYQTRTHLSGVTSLLLLWGFWALNSGHQSCW